VSIPSTPSDLVPLREVDQHRPWFTARYVLELRAQRRLPVWRPGGGRRLYVSLADLDRLVEYEAPLRGPLADRAS
jgi:hypothetical protein